MFFKQEKESNESVKLTVDIITIFKEKIFKHIFYL